MIPTDLTSEARRRVFWPKVALIGSLRFYKEMRGLYEKFSREEIDALVPWPFFRDPANVRRDDKFWPLKHGIYEKFNAETHLLRISSSDLAYIVNIGGYVGVNSAIDIGYAFGKKIPVYAMEEIGDSGVNVLIGGVKTPEEIILLCKEIYNLKYRPQKEEFQSRVVNQ